MKNLPIITRCICTTKKECAEDSRAGLPAIAIQQAFNRGNNETWFSAYCPRCGRGNRDCCWTSIKRALDEWNWTQKCARLDPIVTDDEIAHVGYDDAQLGREK